MDVNSVLRKSVLGDAEIKSRKHSLVPTLRLLLILVDGKKTVRDLHESLLKMPSYKGPKQLQQELNQLIKAGYLEDASVRINLGADDHNLSQWGESDAMIIKRELISMTEYLLGTQGTKVVKKIQAASNTRESVVSAIDDCTKLVRLFIDEDKADQLALKGRKIIASRD